MTIMEFSESVNQTYDDYMLFDTRWNSLMETVELGLEKNIEQAELKVLTEDGDSEDLDILIEAAEDSALDKFKAGVRKLWENVINSIRRIIEKIQNFFSKDRSDNIEKIAKSESGNKTIECPDYKELQAAEMEYENTIKKAEAKAKAGQIPDIDELDAAKAKYIQRRDNALSKKQIVSIAAVMTTLLGIKKYAKNEKNWKQYKHDQEIAEMIGNTNFKKFDKKSEYLKAMRQLNHHSAFVAIEKAMNKSKFIQFVQKKLHRASGTQVNP